MEENSFSQAHAEYHTCCIHGLGSRDFDTNSQMSVHELLYLRAANFEEL